MAYRSSHQRALRPTWAITSWPPPCSSDPDIHEKSSANMHTTVEDGELMGLHTRANFRADRRGRTRTSSVSGAHAEETCSCEFSTCTCTEGAPAFSYFSRHILEKLPGTGSRAVAVTLMNTTINATAPMRSSRECTRQARGRPLTVLSCHAQRGAKPANTHPAGLA